ncbi:phospholipase effector Tle1 domain-containing protein [Vibrio diazotrophicus]|uniref:phospholipase effector Tle1 domain-containing protein n=1 Tax=Vibrio diazotrophicus TaxID=685 RepID=UPI000C9E3946|nr:DUF2235 domain-containing protein [Vibrio diazotrophicus]PNH98684.1 hypothetical protein C1O24_01195 [Vibrio diazotrophicus]
MRLTGPTGASPYCIACENYTNWLEILIRDEHNQPFPNIKGKLIDASGAVYSITVGDAPILLKALAPGFVHIQLDSTSWRSEAERREPNATRQSSINDWLNEHPTGYNKAPRIYHHLPLGHFVNSFRNRDLPPRHKKKALGVVELSTNKSYLVTIQGCRYITLRLGMFFDGTANNTYSAKWGKQRLENYYLEWKSIYAASLYPQQPEHLETSPTRLTEECFNYPTKPKKVESSAANELTNIQKLFDLYRNNEFDDTKTVFSHAQYITGIGTGNSTAHEKAYESSIGLGTGRGDYGIIGKVETGIEQVCEQLGDTLSLIETVSGTKIDGFRKLEFDVFGFSRGAAAARHFINTVLHGKQSLFAIEFSKACRELKAGNKLTGGFEWSSNECCEVMFAGLFDTVAAVLDWGDASAHNEDNAPIQLWLDPKRVRKAIHLTAHKHTEYRKNFSLNKLNIAPHFHELTLPGAHSDLGGGYHSSLAFAQNDYLLPLLENKLIKSVKDTNLPTWGKAKAERLAALTTQLEEALEVEINQGWSKEDYIITEPEVIEKHTEFCTAQAHLLYRKTTQGDLSRLYLRVMYGLAEFSGVPIQEVKQGVVVWNTEHPYYKPNYTVSNQLIYPTARTKSPFSFGELCAQTLVAAKQGQLNKIQQTLGSDEQRANFMNLSLIHHSADENTTAGIIKANAPLKSPEYYCREEYECEQENYLDSDGIYHYHRMYRSGLSG